MAIYDRCNGISQCDDGSDEDPSECGGQMSKAKLSEYTRGIHATFQSD